MIPGVDRLRRNLVIVGLASLLAVGAAAASRTCGRAVLDDWYDNGKIDRSWNCECLLDGLTLLPEVPRSASVSRRDELERKVRARCVDWPVPVNEAELIVSGSELPASESRTMAEATLNEFHPAGSDTGDNYSVPWEIIVAGIVTGGLLVLIGAAAVRQWRLRP